MASTALVPLPPDLAREVDALQSTCDHGSALDAFFDLWQRIHDNQPYRRPEDTFSEEYLIALDGIAIHTNVIKREARRHLQGLRQTPWSWRPFHVLAWFGPKAARSQTFLHRLRDMASREHVTASEAAQGIFAARAGRLQAERRSQGIPRTADFLPDDVSSALTMIHQLRPAVYPSGTGEAAVDTPESRSIRAQSEETPTPEMRHVQATFRSLKRSRSLEPGHAARGKSKAARTCLTPAVDDSSPSPELARSRPAAFEQNADYSPSPGSLSGIGVFSSPPSSPVGVRPHVNQEADGEETGETLALEHGLVTDENRDDAGELDEHRHDHSIPEGQRRSTDGSGEPIRGDVEWEVEDRSSMVGEALDEDQTRSNDAATDVHPKAWAVANMLGDGFARAKASASGKIHGVIFGARAAGGHVASILEMDRGPITKANVDANIDASLHPTDVEKAAIAAARSASAFQHRGTQPGSSARATDGRQLNCERLLTGAWLSDDDVYESLVRLNPDESRIAVLDPLRFESTLGRSRMSRSLRQCTFLIAPMFVTGNHWVVAVADCDTMTCTVYDPMQSWSYAKQAQEMVAPLLKDHRPAHERGANDWRFQRCETTLMQTDSTYCGVYAIVYGLYRMLELDVPKTIIPDVWRNVLAAGFTQKPSPDLTRVIQADVSSASTAAVNVLNLEALRNEWRNMMDRDRAAITQAAKLEAECRTIRDLLGPLVNDTESQIQDAVKFAAGLATQAKAASAVAVATESQVEQLRALADDIQEQADEKQRASAFRCAVFAAAGREAQLLADVQQRLRAKEATFRDELRKFSVLVQQDVDG